MDSLLTQDHMSATHLLTSALCVLTAGRKQDSMSLLSSAWAGPPSPLIEKGHPCLTLNACAEPHSTAVSQQKGYSCPPEPCSYCTSPPLQLIQHNQQIQKLSVQDMESCFSLLTLSSGIREELVTVCRDSFSSHCF